MLTKRILWAVGIALTLTFMACQQEQAPVSESENLETDPEVYLAEAESEIAEAEAEILNNPNYSNEKSVVTLPAGSVDGLQAAIAQAGPWGKVIVQSGMHYESGTVTVTHPVRIIGKKGAVIQSATQNPEITGFPAEFPAALFINGADFVQVRNLEFVPASGVGGVGISVLNSDRVYLRGNTFTDFYSGIWSQDADHLLITRNVIEGPLDKGVFSTGLYHFSGERAKLFRNEIRDFETCFFVCEENGLMVGNETQGGNYGYIFCKWPDGFFAMPGNNIVGAQIPAIDWITVGNDGDSHALATYLITDGAEDNLLVGNGSSNAASYDFDFTGDIQSDFLGLRPAAVSNTYIAGGIQNQIVKDCGIGTTLIGNYSLVDLALDPCRTTDD